MRVAHAAAHGLSPRVRGNRPGASSSGLASGSIPACAGEPVSERCVPGQRTVYPRVCGGTGSPAALAACRSGLSPRVRGNHLGRNVGGRRDAVLGNGSIPACAGEPVRILTALPQREVYPRVCGGTWHRGTVA